MTLPELPPAVSVTRNPRLGPAQGHRPASRASSSTTRSRRPSCRRSSATPPVTPTGRSTSSRSGPAPTARSSPAMALDFTADTPMSQAGGYVFLDIDQDPSTGLPAEALSRACRPRTSAWSTSSTCSAIHDPEPVVFIVDVETFERGRGRRPRSTARRSSSTSRSRPSAATTGTSTPPWCWATSPPRTDWAPDEGHGTIEPFSDVPWIVDGPGVRHGRAR